MLLDGLEAPALERCALDVADRVFDSAFAVRLAYARGPATTSGEALDAVVDAGKADPVNQVLVIAV